MASLAGLPGLVIPGFGLGPGAGAEALHRQSRPGGGGGSGGGGASSEEHDHLYPGGYSADGVRAPIPNRRDRLIGASGDHGPGGGGAVLGGMMQGAMGGMGGVGEESDGVDWIFNVPEVCCLVGGVFEGDGGGGGVQSLSCMGLVFCKTKVPSHPCNTMPGRSTSRFYQPGSHWAGILACCLPFGRLIIDKATLSRRRIILTPISDDVVWVFNRPNGGGGGGGLGFAG